MVNQKCGVDLLRGFRMGECLYASVARTLALYNCTQVLTSYHAYATTGSYI